MNQTASQNNTENKTYKHFFVCQICNCVKEFTSLDTVEYGSTFYTGCDGCQCPRVLEWYQSTEIKA
jgi:hypothetical protein